MFFENQRSGKSLKFRKFFCSLKRDIWCFYSKYGVSWWIERFKEIKKDKNFKFRILKRISDKIIYMFMFITGWFGFLIIFLQSYAIRLKEIWICIFFKRPDSSRNVKSLWYIFTRSTFIRLLFRILDNGKHLVQLSHFSSMKRVFLSIPFLASKFAVTKSL